MSKIVTVCCLLGLAFCATAQTLQTLNVNIANGNDDVEVSSAMYIGSSDLELGGFDASNFGKQFVALRFQNVLLPPNAQVSNAYIQFTTKIGMPTTASVNIKCQQGNATPYNIAENLMLRNYVPNPVTWNPPAWTLTGERGANQKTPNLAAQVNAAIATNWQSGFSLSFILQGNAVTNDVLNARSYENLPTHAGAPELFVEYTIPNTGGGGTNMANLRNIFINEVAPKGTVGFPEDWIELYNGNDVAVRLDSVAITGKVTDPFKFFLRNLTIPARGFLRLIADKNLLLGANHVDLKLSAAGEKLFLFKNVTGVPVQLAAFEFPANDVENVTFGTATDGVLNPPVTNLVTFLGGTPNATNVGGKQFFKITNTVPRGIITPPRVVSLFAPAGATIRYTTDFTQPSRTNGIIYTQPISITNSTVLKTFAYTANGESIVENFTYINPVKGTELRFPNQVTPAEYEAGLKQLPIVSISTAAGAVDTKVEKICGFEYINKFGENASISVLGGVEGYGNDSYLTSEQRNLRIHFKSIYGFSKLAYPIFKKDDVDSKNPANDFDILELKIGQDGPNSDGFGMIMTSQGLLNKTMRELGNVDLHTQYVHAFVNGKYHGVYTLKEKYDEHFAESYYGGQKEQYDEIEGDWAFPIAKPGSTLTNLNLFQTATVQNNFQAVKRYVNVSQFIDYMILMMYFDNEWEFRIIGDKNLVTTKLVFENHDTDGALTKISDENEFAYNIKWTDPLQVVFNDPLGMFGNMVRGNNKEFKTLVRDRVYESLQKQNSALSVSRITTKLTELRNVIFPVFNLELARFNQTFYNNNPYFDEEYNENINHLPTRYQYNLNKWLEKGLAHTLLPVTFSAPSGNVSVAVTAANPNNKGDVYYTIDGSDPMGNDGVISPLARLYVNRLQLNIGANTVVARVLFNGEFGPKTKATYNNSAVLPLAFRLKNVDNQIFTLSPNPADEAVKVDLTNANGRAVELILYNNLGQPLLKQSVEKANGMHQLLLDGLENGQYIIEIRVEGQGTIGRKLIINH